MNTFFTLSILISHTLSVTEFDGAWSNGGTLSRVTAYAIPFTYNNQIFMFGGYTAQKGLLKCDVSTTLSCTDEGTDPNRPNIWFLSQSYTQINDLGYVIGDEVSPTHLYVYKLTSTGPIYQKTITIPIDVKGNKACLTHTNDKLFMVGGNTTHNAVEGKTLQIYDLPNGPWSQGPNMNRGRELHSCVTLNDYLYAIGGNNAWRQQIYFEWSLDTIEKIQITNILNNKWKYTTNNLKNGIEAFTALVSDPYIITVGGHGGIPVAEAVQIFNTNDGTIKYGGKFATQNTAYGSNVFHLNGKIYAVGGYDTLGTQLDTWQYVRTGTNSPTADPTKTPTKQPTNVPTRAPTNQPTAGPTRAPTNQPSTQPTRAPTNQPSVGPTNQPTNVPTRGTYSPSVTPTGPPSKTPSLSPLFAGETLSPVKAPTTNPMPPTPQPTAAANNPSGSILIVNSIYTFIFVLLLVGFGF